MCFLLRIDMFGLIQSLCGSVNAMLLAHHVTASQTWISKRISGTSAFCFSSKKTFRAPRGERESLAFHKSPGLSSSGIKSSYIDGNQISSLELLTC